VLTPRITAAASRGRASFMSRSLWMLSWNG